MADLVKNVWSRDAGGRIRLAVCAVPGASNTGVAGIRPDCLRVRVAAAPEKGKANEELLAWLASQLGVRKSALELASGATARQKIVLLPAECLGALERLLAGI